jgi:hypothetical protein
MILIFLVQLGNSSKSSFLQPQRTSPVDRFVIGFPSVFTKLLQVLEDSNTLVSTEMANEGSLMDFEPFVKETPSPRILVTGTWRVLVRIQVGLREEFRLICGCDSRLPRSQLKCHKIRF